MCKINVRNFRSDKSIICILSFGVIPRRLNATCRRLGTLSHFQEMELSVPKCRHIMFRRRGITPKERIQIIDLFTKGGKSDKHSNELPLQLAPHTHTHTHTHTYIQYNIHVPPLLCWGGGVVLKLIYAAYILQQSYNYAHVLLHYSFVSQGNRFMH